MNRFRLLEAAPRAEFTRYTGLPESVIRPQIDEALAQGYLTECDESPADHRARQAVPELPS